jgi:hypothetical protein
MGLNYFSTQLCVCVCRLNGYYWGREKNRGSSTYIMNLKEKLSQLSRHNYITQTGNYGTLPCASPEAHLAAFYPTAEGEEMFFSRVCMYVCGYVLFFGTPCSSNRLTDFDI